MAKKKKKRIELDSDEGGLVYSTGSTGTLADFFEQASGQGDIPQGQRIISVRRETKGRGGKPCVVCSGFGMDAAELKQVAKELKQACGVGGSQQDDTILIQGDIIDKVMDRLKAMGFKVKRTGG